MDHKFRAKIIIASVIAALVAAIVVIAIIGDGAGGSDSSSFVTFLPIWIAIFVPIFAARQQREREKAKRRLSIEDEDIYSMMNRLMDDLDDEETDYLKRRLQNKFGDTLGNQS